MKDYYQKWMEEQAQSLIDKTSKQTANVVSARRKPCSPWLSDYQIDPAIGDVVVGSHRAAVGVSDECSSSTAAAFQQGKIPSTPFPGAPPPGKTAWPDRKSTRLNSSHL